MVNNNEVEAKDAHQLLDDIIASEDRSSCNERYNKWASSYEDDMHTVDYFGPTRLMEHFVKFGLPKSAKVLDVCAGTGALGRELVKQDYTDIHALDGAENMLAKAKEEGNYKSYTHFLFEPDSKFPFADQEFDCVLLAGVFAPGHLPIVALREICRITKKGGMVAFICCDPAYYESKDMQYSNGGFYKIVESLKSEGCWREHEGYPVPVPYIKYSGGFIMAFDVTGP